MEALAYRLAHKAEKRVSTGLWTKANLTKKLVSYNTRRARKLDAFVEEVDREQVFLNDVGICQWQYCSEPSPFVDPSNWHLDHIIPLSKSGEHSYSNTQVTHPICNLRKGTT